MPFPDSKRVVYGENPLTEVICQLRFPPILDISTVDPAEFQGHVRRLFPLYKKAGPGLSVGLPAEVPEQVQNIVTQFVQGGDVDTRHKFLTDDELRAITLTRDFVAVTDRRYVTWEKFKGDIELARNALEKVYEPAFYSRVGLRYKDVIDRSQLGLEEEPWDALLSEELIGSLLAAENLRDRVRRVQTVAQISVDEVVGGYVILRHGLLDQTQDGEAQTYTIDADFYSEEREATKDVTASLDLFNGLAGRLFRWAIKDRLHEALRPS